jgi:hypothetical protein
VTVPSLTHFPALYFNTEDGDAYVCDSTVDMTHTPEDLTLPPFGSYLSIHLSNTSLLIHPGDGNDELYMTSSSSDFLRHDARQYERPLLNNAATTDTTFCLQQTNECL